MEESQELASTLEFATRYATSYATNKDHIVQLGHCPASVEQIRANKYRRGAIPMHIVSVDRTEHGRLSRKRLERS